MSDSIKYTPSPAFDRAAREFDIPVRSFWFNIQPASQAARLEGRIKMAAKLLAKATQLPHSQTLGVVAQALRFQSWHHLSKHLSKAQSFSDLEPLPEGWLDALSSAVVLTIEVEDDVALSVAALDALESFGRTLSMLTGVSADRVLDTVSAGMCGGRSWVEVRARSPLNAVEPLYHFVAPDGTDVQSLEGWLTSSPACSQLGEMLGKAWDGYDSFTKAQKRKAYQQVEAMLAVQPAFLDGGLALGWMQKKANDPAALDTAARYVRMADSLVPKGFKGRILWGPLDNRVFHRLHWLHLSLNHWYGNPAAAVKTARKLLRLNPNDNLGLRYVLPLLLLQQDDVAGAKRSLKAMKEEPDLVPSALRAFVSFAAGEAQAFRANLARALFTLPILRAFLLNDPNALPAGEDGYRSRQPDIDTFAEFAWPVYVAKPALRQACMGFLAEPEVLCCEQELREYWSKYWGNSRPGRVPFGSPEGWDRLVDACVMRAA